MLKNILLLSLIFAGHLLAADFPDGKWNGKPWPREELQSKAEAKNPDAMAEWAFDASLIYSDLPYDPTKILSYARLSADAGSLLGKTMCGVFMREGFHQPMDAPGGAKLIVEAAKEGHPHAMHLQSLYMMRGIYDGQAIKGLPRDLPAALKIYHQAKELGAIATSETEWRILRWGAEGVVDINAAYEKAMKCYELEISNNTLDALFLYSKKSIDIFHELINDEDADLIWQSMKEGADRGHHWATHRIETEDGKNIAIHTKDNNFNIGIPLLIKSSRGGSYVATLDLFFLMRKSFEDGHHDNRPFMAGGEDKYDMSYLMYDNGAYQNDEDVATYYLYQKSRMVRHEGEVNEDVITAFRDLCRAHPSSGILVRFAQYLDESHLKKENPDLATRGHRLFILASQDELFAVYGTAESAYFNQALGADRLVFWAAAMHASNQNPGEGLLANENWQEIAEKKFETRYQELSPEQKKQAQILIAKDYPKAVEFRRKAYQDLQKSGDMPMESSFEQYDERLSEGERKYEENENNTEVEEVYFRDSPPSNLFSAPFAAQPATSLVSDEREKNLARYLKGEKFTDDDATALAALFLSDAKELRDLIAASKDEGKIAKNMELVLDEITAQDLGENPLGAVLGWWLMVENGQPSSIPWVAMQHEGSPAEKCGLMPGDVIDACQGLKLSGPESRNTFARLIQLWPPDLPLELSIRRAKNPKGPRDPNPRSERKNITIRFDTP